MPSLSFIIPTRERAKYLRHSLATCLANDDPDLEVLVLDNASTDSTREVATGSGDARVRYLRSDGRLSMRHNFERGLDEARGDILCFIGDDDGVFPDAARRVRELFGQSDIDAVSAARAHYFWPDFPTARRNTSLLPRGTGIQVRDSQRELRYVLDHADYYRLPCLYHGFVRRNLVDRIRRQQGGVFFLSNNVDIFSSIAISAEGLSYAYSEDPLVINGGSARSNGASYARAGQPAAETVLWTKEDDLGFLDGFGDSLTLASFIVESSLRYLEQRPEIRLSHLFHYESIRRAMQAEVAKRLAAGRSRANAAKALLAVGCSHADTVAASRSRWLERVSRLTHSYLYYLPVTMERHGVSDVHGAAQHLFHLRSHKRTGLAHAPLAQMQAAARLAAG